MPFDGPASNGPSPLDLERAADREVEGARLELETSVGVWVEALAAADLLGIVMKGKDVEEFYAKLLVKRAAAKVLRGRA